MGEGGVHIPENYNFPPTGEVLAMHISLITKPGTSGDRKDLHDHIYKICFSVISASELYSY